MNTLSLKSIVFFFITFVFSIYKADAQQTINGFVFEDANHNGVKDKNEAGIKGVTVSDQVNVVITNDDGAYNFPAAKGNGLLFISTPDGFKNSDTFWKIIDTTQKVSTINFALIKTKPITSFTFIHASDTHISPASIDRMKKLEKITDSVKPEMMLITGDLIKDALRVPEPTARGLYELFKTERNNIHTSTWLVPGNHEIFGIERHLSLVSPSNPLYGRKMYRYYFGPDYYSFNYGGIHFIALNSLDFEDLWYYGKIDSTQIEWLKRDVANVSAQMPIVTFQHVPFYSGGLSMQNYEGNGPARTVELEQGVIQYRHVVSNTQDILAILKNHNYPLALAGHHHYQQKFSFAGIQTRFEQTAAVVGPGGEGDLELPSGIMVYTVKDGKIDEGKFVTLDR